MTKPFVDSRPPALMLAPESPYPLAGGGAMRTGGLLHYLAKRYDVDLLVFREPGARDPAETIPPSLVRRVQAIELPYHSKSSAARARRNALRFLRGVPPLVDRFAGFGSAVAALLGNRRYALAVVEHFWCALYVERLARAADRTVLDLHNVESVLHSRCAVSERWAEAVAHRWFATRSRALERRWLPRFDLVLAPSERDAALVGALAPAARAAVYPNSIPRIERPTRQAMDAIVFSGNMEYHPNRSAIAWFAGRVWPSLRARRPSLNWLLIGRGPKSVLHYMESDPRIRVIGEVDNAVEALALAKVAVTPLLAGSGTRVKILEAWAAGVPVVSTTIGAEGLPALDGENLLIADDPAAFATAVETLLDSPDLRQRIGGAGRALYEKEFTWEAGWRYLERTGI
jgi:glycosyltransferase involved in cell wall biosynthesis